MSKCLFLILRDTSGQRQPLKLKFEIQEHALAQKWYKLLVENFFDQYHPIEKTNCLKGWQSSWDSLYSRNLEYLCTRINLAVKRVNTVMNAKGYPKIDLYFSLDTLKNNLQILEEAQRQVSILSSTEWKPFQNKQVEFEISAIITLAEEIDSVLKSIRSRYDIEYAPIQGQDFTPTFYMSTSIAPVREKTNFLLKQEPLTEEDYNCFIDYSTWGSIDIHYSQLGKYYYKAFIDDDNIIDNTDLCPHEIVTGEFFVTFPTIIGARDRNVVVSKSFKEWLANRGFDYTDPSLRLGNPQVATIVMPEGYTRSQLSEEMFKRDDLVEMGIEDSDGSVLYSRKEYYTWREQDVNPYWT